MKADGLITIWQGLLYCFIKGEFKFIIANTGTERVNRDAGGEQEAEIDQPWVAWLMFPKCDKNEAPSINEFSPTIAEGKMLREILDKIEQWYVLNLHKESGVFDR